MRGLASCRRGALRFLLRGIVGEAERPGERSTREGLSLFSSCQAVGECSFFTKRWQRVCLGLGSISVRAGISASGLGEEHISRYLSALVFCLLFLVEHRIHMGASSKQCFICKFCADSGQDFFRSA